MLDGIAGRKLDLGCGSRKVAPDYVGVDLLDLPDVDLVGDVMDVLGAIPDGVLEGVYSSHFFEHVESVPALLDELARVIRVGGELDVIVPHFSNPYYYSDLTHRSFFGLYSFSYLARDTLFRREVPSYGREARFVLRSAQLRFKSPRPFYGRYAAKRMIQVAVNASRWTREFYEENLTYLIPCYEIRFKLERADSAA